MTGKILKIVVPLALLALIVTAWAAEAPEKMETRRLAEQAQTYRVSNKDIHNLPVADGPQDRMNSWMATQAADRSIIQDNYSAHTGLGVTSAAPGIKVAATTYDFQHNDANPHQIAKNRGPLPSLSQYVHFAWTHWDVIPESLDQIDRFVNFNTYKSTTGAFIHGVDGVTISGGGVDPKTVRGGFVGLDIDKDNRAHVAFHQRDGSDTPPTDYMSWELDQASPIVASFAETALPGSKGAKGNADDDVIWPHVTVDQRVGNPDIVHVVSHPYNSTDNIIYWRWIDGGIWKGPYAIDSCFALSYNIAADRGSDKCALVCENDNVTGSNPDALLQVVYRESSTNGDDWGPVSTTGLGDAKRVFITNYAVSTGPQAWTEAVGDYDNGSSPGNLHVVWVEQRFANTTEHSSMKHWDKLSNSISTISLAYYDAKGANGGRDCNSAYPTIGFGDGSTTCGGGSNLNYIYMTFVQFGGTSVAQQNDFSAAGYMNGEVYLSTSNNGGALWSPAVNLTNSMFPGCDPELGPADSCPSENFPSIARTIDDTIHIQYINDRDAGDAVFGQGSWTFNPVMYLRIPPRPVDKQPVCPLIAPNFGAELSDANGGDCEYNTPPNTSISESLTLTNVGNKIMTGTVSRVYVSPPSGQTWLTVTGAGSYNIPAGGTLPPYPVLMNAAGLPEGLRTALIRIVHDDPTKTTPYDIPVDFFVFNDFACPEYVTLHTKWLEMEVSNIEREAIARPVAKLRGLYRPGYALSGLTPTADSGNNSIFDGSLIIARTPNPSAPPPGDTLVYRYLFGQGEGQPGFRALSGLEVNTDAYGTGSGTAYASAIQTTVDSLIGIDVEYIFPQDPNLANLVLLKYKIYNRTTDTILGLIIGEAVDFDVVPSTVNAKWQSATQNYAGFNTSMNLLFQQGCDSGTTTWAQQYYAGMTAIQCTQSPRAWIAPNDPWLFGRPGGGFTEGYLYSQMVKTGFEVLGPPPVAPAKASDKHSVMVFEKNVTLYPTTVKYYLKAFVTSTLGPAQVDLLATVKKAWKFAFGWQNVVPLDTLPENTPAAYPYYASGSHEGGPAGGGCGCLVTKVAGGSALLTFAGDADPCTGTINFAGAAAGTYTAVFRVTTLGAVAPVLTDDQTVTIVVSSGTGCLCPNQGDVINDDAAVDVFDVIQEIAIAFSGGDDIQDPGCPTTRGDVINNDAAVDVFDVIQIIAIAFSGGSPQDPCAP